VGHHCQIWRAYQEGRHQTVAIKMLLEKFHRSREHQGYLKREYAAGSAVVHERIVRMVEYGVDHDVPYLAIEWFPAPNLNNRIRLGQTALAPLVPKIVVQASEAVAVFNAAGWVHRDVKPANFLVADDGEVKLIDFALAQRRKSLLTKWFAPKSRAQGTPSYISPEQIRGAAVDQRADLYSLGCTLFELLAGRPPFTASSATELLNKHLRATPPPLESACPNVNPEFAQLIRRAMAKEPAARFRSTEAFYHNILQTPVFSAGEGSSAAVGDTPI
jgi:serine/threonine protein kinase